MYESNDKILLVEGPDDTHVITNLWMTFEDKKEFKLCDIKYKDENGCYGVEGVIKKLGSILKTSDNLPKIIGIVIDANNSLNARWQQIRNRLVKQGYQVPESPDTNGTIIENSDKPKVGIWLMPNNHNSGMLEHFLSEMIEEEALNIAKNCVNIAKDSRITKFKENDEQKAIVHTYLAWMDEPGRPYGIAIKDKNKLNHETAAQFINWLNALFIEEKQ